MNQAEEFSYYTIYSKDESLLSSDNNSTKDSTSKNNCMSRFFKYIFWRCCRFK